MADQDRTTPQSVQCWPDTKAKYSQAAATLNASLAEVADLAIEALLPLLADEETPEQRRARILSKSGSTRVRVKSDSGLTAVGQ